MDNFDEIIEEEAVDIDKVISAKRHRDMMKVLNSLASAFSQNKPSVDLQPLVNQNKELITNFISKLQELSQPSSPNVNVNVNQEKVISSLTEMTKTITQGMKSLEDAITTLNDKKPIAYDFKITERNFAGFAQKITATPKL